MSGTSCGACSAQAIAFQGGTARVVKRGFHFRVTRHDSINFVSDRSVVKRRRIPRDSVAVPIVSFEQLPEEKPPWPTCSMRRTRTVRLSLAAR